jgi:hypothetical protein
VATRLYFQSTGSAPFSPAFADGGWERDSAAYAAYRTSTAKWNSALTTLSAVFGSTATSQTRYGAWVSPPLDVAQTISGTFSLVVGKCAETTTSGDAHLAYAVRVVDSAGAHRATLATVMATSTEFPVVANAATRIHNGTAISSFAANAGDRIVIELGIHGVTPANETMQMRVGDPTGTADFALTAALTTDLDPWGEFSQNLTFGAPATSSAAGVATTTVTRGAKRLIAAIAAAGVATCAVTASIISPPADTTATAEGTSSATASIGRLRGATVSTSGTGATTVTISRAPIARTAAASGLSTATASLTAQRRGTASVAGTGAASATLVAVRSGAASASGTSTVTAGLHAIRLAGASSAGAGAVSVNGVAIRHGSASASGTSTATATLTRVTTDSTATAAGSGAATVTGSLIRAASVGIAGSSTATVVATALRGGSAIASGTASASATATTIRSCTAAAAGQATATATIDTVSISSVALSDLAVITASVVLAEETTRATVAVLTPTVTITDLSPVPSITVP